MVEILLAEDNRVLRQSLTATLEKAGYAVRAVRDGQAALDAYHAARPNLLLLDILMPKCNGRVVCKKIRREDPQLPILFLTALDSEGDELKGLGIGADDYLPKTISDERLLARISAVLRRVEPRTDAFFFAGARVDPENLTLVSSAGVSSNINERELALLRFFAAHPGEVFTRDSLLSRFWPSGATENSLTLLIFHLREKLADDAPAIRSVHAFGYSYSPNEPSS